MMEEKLQKGWRVSTIPELISKDGIFSDGDWVESKDQDPNGDVRLIQLADIGDGVYKDKSERFLTSEKASQLRCTYLKSGDILIARMPDPLGRSCIFPLSGKFVTVVDVAIIRPTCNSKWLMYWINTPQFRAEIFKNASGSTRLRISRKNLSQIKFPLPTLPEQQRIVAKLDALFGHLDSLREKLDGIPALLKNFRQQVLTQAVTGELTKEWREGKGLGEWEYIDLQEVADVVDPHPSHRTPPPVIGGIPYISIKDVDSKGRIDFSNSTLVSSKVLEEHIKRYELKEGDLGFGKIGTLGKPFQLPIFKERTYTLSANIILIQPKSNYNPKFLFYYLDSPIINKLLKEGAKATSQPAFGIKKARVFPTPNPSKEEQKEIVSQVDALFSLADKIESQYVSLKAKIDQLPQAILAKAFRGELVSQEVKEYVLEEGEGLMAAEKIGFYKSKK
ncbi:restriction endonuclease subunit S [Mongoliitalea daihaiensis]|uniref:restriction endonuclease subunit S n=1 Tax=Mongoliitalea daihaiensis TaxID=2782006 RepID=UPI001F1746C1|nr:restriction endonuclease subunit S [Mongoliitalea daihaiensis]UJP65170.1 restriction endonuclease subunit S [Mongoliitalea daihaiensis]